MAGGFRLLESEPYRSSDSLFDVHSVMDSVDYQVSLETIL